MGSTVRALENFNIDIYKLSNDSHDYQFDIGNSFFEAFPGKVVEKGSGKAHVELRKTESLIEVSFDISVSVELECDRTLDPFDYKIDLTQGLILKFGDEEEVLDDEIIVIPRDQQRVNLAQHIYEFIGLAIPMKKLHPKFDREDNSDEVVYSSESEKEETKDEAIDPRWQALKDLNKK